MISPAFEALSIDSIFSLWWRVFACPIGAGLLGNVFPWPLSNPGEHIGWRSRNSFVLTGQLLMAESDATQLGPLKPGATKNFGRALRLKAVQHVFVLCFVMPGESRVGGRQKLSTNPGVFHAPAALQLVSCNSV